MTNKLTYEKFTDIFKKFRNSFINFDLDKNHTYYTTSLSMLDNKMNEYVNYINFKEIHKILQDEKNLKVVDIGCGIGDKAYVLKQLFPSFDISGFETVNYDDPHHQATNPHVFFSKVYSGLEKAVGISCKTYDGSKVDLPDSSVDVVLLYAVVEHVGPEHRLKFMKEMDRILKPGGQMIITRCPRYFGLMEFISRKLKLGAHEWVLKKSDLLGLFDSKKYRVKFLKRMNNVPNNQGVTKGREKAFILMDKILDFFRWPFSTDYFLAIEKVF